jgi:hypothetical protein
MARQRYTLTEEEIHDREVIADPTRIGSVAYQDAFRRMAQRVGDAYQRQQDATAYELQSRVYLLEAVLEPMQMLVTTHVEHGARVDHALTRARTSSSRPHYVAARIEFCRRAPNADCGAERALTALGGGALVEILTTLAEHVRVQGDDVLFTFVRSVLTLVMAVER